METLANVVAFTEGETASDGSAGTWGDGRVECIDVKTEMDGAFAFRVDTVEGHFDDSGDTVLVDVVHGKGGNFIVADDLFFGGIDVTETDVSEATGFETGFYPLEAFGVLCNTGEEGERTAMEITRLCAFWGVDISMCIDPNEAGVGVLCKDA